ncbi:hypothetical protein [Rhodococcus sp. IEGM 1318]|uniref:hypothetical protein n=1 Tax=Rhodococcus sp. IEGM 1318 TaxID=3082226 RepID=UPI0029535BC6|nr:hypothetical protein [Rhodococcus sp. IEGM 1318]MDV8006429.1 hypothetical protein [Rhodococcus sp. IEGM 1318]
MSQRTLSFRRAEMRSYDCAIRTFQYLPNLPNIKPFTRFDDISYALAWFSATISVEKLQFRHGLSEWGRNLTASSRCHGDHFGVEP